MRSRRSANSAADVTAYRMIDVISSARHRTDGLFWLLSWVPVLTLVQVAPAASDQPNDGPSPKSAPTSIKDFAPGVHIDWANRAVEIDARVVLRSGPLELLACSPKTREHESILVVDARPLHVYQALGLIGLAPGSPSRFDEASRKAWSKEPIVSGAAPRGALRAKDPSRRAQPSASTWRP